MKDNHEHSGLRCTRCNDKIYSQHRHDFKRCKCGACFVDGGTEYLRCGWDEHGRPPAIIDKDGNDIQQE